MLKNYFKIFLKIASQNKLFTFLSLFGISLTIMFVMIFSMTISKITSGSGPESDLKKMIFSDRVKTEQPAGIPGRIIICPVAEEHSVRIILRMLKVQRLHQCTTI